MRVVIATEESLLFAAEGNEQDAPLGRLLPVGQVLGDLKEAGHAAGVVIGSVVDAMNAIERELAAHAKVVVMRTDDHNLIAQLGVRAAQERHDILRLGQLVPAGIQRMLAELEGLLV